jgi:hypothetical protein
VLDRLVKLAHSISNRPLADAAPASRQALESELRPLDEQVGSSSWVGCVFWLRVGVECSSINGRASGLWQLKCVRAHV